MCRQRTTASNRTELEFLKTSIWSEVECGLAEDLSSISEVCDQEVPLSPHGVPAAPVGSGIGDGVFETREDGTVIAVYGTGGHYQMSEMCGGRLVKGCHNVCANW